MTRSRLINDRQLNADAVQIGTGRILVTVFVAVGVVRGHRWLCCSFERLHVGRTESATVPPQSCTSGLQLELAICDTATRLDAEAKVGGTHRQSGS
jgi:hypothetical protein